MEEKTALITSDGVNTNIITNKLIITANLEVYESNDDAKVGGLPIGCLYRNSLGDLKIVF